MDGRDINAIGFFDECRKSVRKLKALNDRLDDMADNGYLHAMGYEALGSSGGIASAVERAALSEDALLASIRKATDRYAELLYLAQQAMSEMEADGADSDGDVALLDYYYLQAKGIRACARLMGYSESHIRHKKAPALVHIAPYVPRDW